MENHKSENHPLGRNAVNLARVNSDPIRIDLTSVERWAWIGLSSMAVIMGALFAAYVIIIWMTKFISLYQHPHVGPW